MKFYQGIILIALIILVLFFLQGRNNRHKIKIKKYELTIDSLRLDIDSLRSDNIHYKELNKSFKKDKRLLTNELNRKDAELLTFRSNKYSNYLKSIESIDNEVIKNIIDKSVDADNSFFTDTSYCIDIEGASNIATNLVECNESKFEIQLLDSLYYLCDSINRSNELIISNQDTIIYNLETLSKDHELIIDNLEDKYSLELRRERFKRFNKWLWGLGGVTIGYFIIN